jgi:hypothetical protein
VLAIKKFEKQKNVVKNHTSEVNLKVIAYLVITARKI